MYFLTGTIGGRFVRIPLSAGRHRVGRGSRNEISLDGETVSRTHAELVVADGRVSVRDLGSSNGTWLRGRRIAGAVGVEHDDVISFGAQEMILLESGRPDTTARPVPGRARPGAAAELGEGLAVHESLTLDEVTSAVVPGGDVSPALFNALTESGSFLVHQRPLAETIDRLLGMVEKIVPARRILLLLADTPGGVPTVRASRPEGESGTDTGLSRAILNAVLAKRRALALNDIPRDPRLKDRKSVILQRMRSALVAPLFDNRQVIGLLYADSDDPSCRYGRDQLRAFTLMANLIAVKISNADLYEARRMKERMEREMAAAADVQRRLLTSELPEVPGYDIVARLIPCHETAGDLYDVARLEDGRTALVVGDVTGKGLPAAMLVSSVMTALRHLYREGMPARDIAARLHRSVYDYSDELHFVTMFCGLLDPRTHVLEYFNAGHTPPLLVAEKDGRCSAEAIGPTGMPLGLVPWAEYQQQTIELPPDRLLCVYSDGISEARRGDDFYGDRRVVESLAGGCDRTLEEVADGVIAALRGFMSGTPLEDDVTLMLLRRGRG